MILGKKRKHNYIYQPGKLKLNQEEKENKINKGGVVKPLPLGEDFFGNPLRNKSSSLIRRMFSSPGT